MQHPKKRVGVIGYGAHLLRSHVAVWGEAFELTAIFDPSSRVFEIAGQDVTVCISPDKLVARDDVDVVMIGSPDKFHPEQLALAVDAGKHVLCEKPLAITEQGMKRVRSTLEYAEREGLVVASCHPRRYSQHRSPLRMDQGECRRARATVRPPQPYITQF